MGENQYGRKYRIIIGHNAIKIEDFDIEFEITQTLTPEPNNADITVYGLDKKTISSIIDAETPPLIFSVGYENTAGIVFIGDARDCYAEETDTENILYINSGDHENNIRTKRINKTYRAGTSVQTVISDLIKILDLQSGNIGTKYSALRLTEGSNQYVNGLTLNGNASTCLKNVLRSCNLSYSVQNKELLALKVKEGLTENPTVFISSVVGNPVIGSDNTLRAKTLLDPRIKPGILLSVEGNIIKGEHIRHYGATAPQQNWYTEFEGRLVSGKSLTDTRNIYTTLGTT